MSHDYIIYQIPNIIANIYIIYSLVQVHRIINFTPTLLKIAMQNDIDMPVRQAAAVYLKNEIVQNWPDKESDGSGAPIAFAIHEQDRAQVRDSIVEAIAVSPEIIRYFYIYLYMNAKYIHESRTHAHMATKHAIASQIQTYDYSDNNINVI